MNSDPTTDPALQRLFTAARRSLERTGGSLDSAVTIRRPTPDERKAINGFTGVYRDPAVATIRVRLADLDQILSRATGSDLRTVLERLGGPLRDRPAEKAAATDARAAARAVADASSLAAEPWFLGWLDALERGPALGRLIAQNAVGRLTDAIRVLERLTRPDAQPVLLPALAAETTGDTKALNRDTPLSTLVLRALALRADVPFPTSADGIRALWEQSGVVVDDLASRVLVLNLPADGDALGSWLTDAARHGTPFQVTHHQLTRHPITPRASHVFLCENPAILRRAAEDLGPACPPLICAEGQPSAAFHRLLRLASASGARLAYHGDFDWPGIAIATAILTTHHATPWRMTAADYTRHAATIPTTVPLTGTPQPTPWDSALSTWMAKHGKAIYEESVAEELLEDLERGATPRL